MSPAGSAAAFYRALLSLPGWEVMTVTAAAHEVQGNQDPGFYTPYESTGRALFASLTGSAAPVVRSATLTTPACTAAAADAAWPAGTDLGARAARTALQWLGVPYVWGGLDTANGMDCSGMVVEAYAAAGLNLLARTIRTANDMYHSVTVLPITGLSPGDLVFSEIDNGHAGHVASPSAAGRSSKSRTPGTTRNSSPSPRTAGSLPAGCTSNSNRW